MVQGVSNRQLASQAVADGKSDSDADVCVVGNQPQKAVMIDSGRILVVYANAASRGWKDKRTGRMTAMSGRTSCCAGRPTHIVCESGVC